MSTDPELPIPGPPTERVVPTWQKVIAAPVVYPLVLLAVLVIALIGALMFLVQRTLIPMMAFLPEWLRQRFSIGYHTRVKVDQRETRDDD